ncbi:MAG: insulinase family protein, partial [Leptospiraceae bacterium]|nr:insulinase family protein [Leptospiraceae bacterium]
DVYKRQAFDESPYSRPVIGYASNIPYLDIYETENFFRTYYTPDNMVIGIVGDIDFEKTEELVKKYFLPLKAQKTKRKKHRVLEQFHKGEKRFQFEYPGGSILMLGFHKPTLPTKEDVAFNIIDSILTQGIGSRLYQAAVLKEQLCSQVSAWTTYPGERFSNLFTIIAYLNSDAKPEKLEEVIWKELDRLKNGDFTEEEIERAKNKITADFLRQIDSNSVLADNLTYYELLLGNWEEIFLGYDRLNSITKQDVMQVSQKYFQKSNSVFGLLIGQKQ